MYWAFCLVLPIQPYMDNSCLISEQNGTKWVSRSEYQQRKSCEESFFITMGKHKLRNWDMLFGCEGEAGAK